MICAFFVLIDHTPSNIRSFFCTVALFRQVEVTRAKKIKVTVTVAGGGGRGGGGFGEPSYSEEKQVRTKRVCYIA